MTGSITKVYLGSQGQYKFVVNTDDHNPPHIHISEHNKQIGSYHLKTGLSYRSNNRRLDKFVISWLSQNDNGSKAIYEWERIHGKINE